MRSSGDGFLWPNLAIVPAGDVTSLLWGAAPYIHSPSIRYLSGGQAWVSTSEVQTSLGKFVEVVVLRLKEYGINDTPLQEEWSRLGALDQDEVTFCEAAARLGLDPFSEGLDHADAITTAFERLDPELHADFFDAVPSEAIDDVLAWILESLSLTGGVKQALNPQFGLDLVSSVVRKQTRALDEAPPWVIGHDTAHVVRQELGLSPVDRMRDDIPVRTQVRPSYVPSLAGVGATLSNADWTSLVARASTPEAQRFAAARALWHAAATDTPSLYLLTSSNSTNQQIGRAFAAELLAPAEGIRQLLDLDGSQPTEGDLGRAAKHFGASDWVIGHQVENQLAYG